MENNTTENVVHDNKNIADLEFSIRAFNCLQRAGIITIADLKKFSIDDLMKIRNMGKNTLEEIMCKMKELDVELKGCEYCSNEKSKDTSLETENYRIYNQVNVTISIFNKKTNELIEEKNIKDSSHLKYCPFCGKKIRYI